MERKRSCGGDGRREEKKRKTRGKEIKRGGEEGIEKKRRYWRRGEDIGNERKARGERRGDDRR